MKFSSNLAQYYVVFTFVAFGLHSWFKRFGLRYCIPAVAGFALSNPGFGAEFQHDIRPILEKYCFDCHADGANKGNVAFDEFKSDRDAIANRDLWWRALKNLRAGIMPPAKKPQPNIKEKEEITLWIKHSVFRLDPKDPDPGHVTIRRLNRTEYRNTIRDLLGVDFDAKAAFPADETGYGFDNVGDVLTLPPMLLEKYVQAANQIVSEAVPVSEGSHESRNYRRFFPDAVPDGPTERRAYAHRLLGAFARKAFRRPASAETVERLAGLAEKTYSQPGKTFEGGVAQAIVAILASPRMLFLEERPEKDPANSLYPWIDEFSLASRLSYFLWSTMPDEELLHLAETGKLRKNLAAQIERMLKDKRSAAFVRDFTGQWLRARDIETVPIESRIVLARDEKFDPERDRRRKRFHELRDKPEEKLTPEEKEELAGIRATFRKFMEQEPRVELTGKLRAAMRLETEKVFDYILREDRSLLELLDSDYTFLNERLAKHYGITNSGITSEEMQLVKLPADSPRGGILTEGTILGVTSNPTRTSPVKRGLFILDSVLGTPPPPPPANIPPLEDAAQKVKGHAPSLRETLAAHRDKPLCASCHNRMDPLGLALENFNAMGMWRPSELGQPIDSTGELITGEKFDNIRELKHILVKNHHLDFYRTITEKMLTYAVGRGLEYYDVETVDQIVSHLESANGRPSALIRGIIDSAPFQRMRSGNEQEKVKMRAENLNKEPFMVRAHE